MFGGRRGDQPVAVALHDGLVVADEDEAAVEQTQGQVRLARSRRPVISTARPSVATVLAWTVSAERRDPAPVAAAWFIRGPPPASE